MRKRYMTAAAAIMAGLMIVQGGCSRQQVQETAAESAAETEMESGTESENPAESGEDSSAEESAEKTESEVSDTGADQEEVEAGEAEEQETRKDAGEAGTDPAAPVHIWGTIISVGEEGILVDNQSENSSEGEILLTIDPDQTLVLDGVQGYPVMTEDIQTGAFEAYLGPDMTASLPPQATPRMVIVNIPEDKQAPAYAISTGRLQEKNGEKILAANDGTEYVLGADVEIIPYLTRNIVSLNDIKKDSRVLLWFHKDDGSVSRIMLFAQ